MRSQKRATAARNAEWAQAVREGRVVRFNNGASFKSLPTVREATAEVARLISCGIFAEIVPR